VTLDEIYRRYLETWSDIQGHLEFMHDTVLGDDVRTVVELGVRSGVSTSAFLAALYKADAHRFGEGLTHLWSIDVNQPPIIDEFYRSGLWTFIQGNDLEVRACVPEQIDVLFIDTLHHYDHTINELNLYGGQADVILMHDTDLEHPHGAPRRDPAFPVRAAIGMWLHDHPDRSVTYLEGSYGMGVIR
jgi:hypothetical protein